MRDRKLALRKFTKVLGRSGETSTMCHREGREAKFKLREESQSRASDFHRKTVILFPLRQRFVACSLPGGCVGRVACYQCPPTHFAVFEKCATSKDSPEMHEVTICEV